MNSQDSTQLLIKLDDLITGQIVKRPSKFIKSPYVADTLITNTDNEIIVNNENTILLHTASLGCCGLADTGAKILMSKIPSKTPKNKTVSNEKPKCEYRAYLSIYNDATIIGIHPKLAEDIVEQALLKNYFSKLQLKNTSSYKRETKIYVENKVDSRFDFSGIDNNGIPFILEVKNVPLADFEDISSSERKKKNYAGRHPNSKIAYFPDGYRKKSSDPVSPRALKHMRELTIIKKESKTRCIMCYVVQRTDVDRFTISIIDPEYKECVKKGMEAGVEIMVIVVEWQKTGEAYLVTDQLPIVDM
jgi:DNA-binding sugar fermentation-stimulating protein